MGFAICRFNKDTGCYVNGSQEWYIHLTDLNKTINVPSMWKHYMIDHLIQPTIEERETIMAANPEKAEGNSIMTRSFTGKNYNVARPAELMVLYVERLGPNQYTHEIGEKPDTEFISKLEKILEKVEPLQTKGFDTKPGYR